MEVGGNSKVINEDGSEIDNSGSVKVDPSGGVEVGGSSKVINEDGSEIDNSGSVKVDPGGGCGGWRQLESDQ